MNLYEALDASNLPGLAQVAVNVTENLCVGRYYPPRGYTFYLVSPLTGKGRITRYRNIDEVSYVLRERTLDGWQAERKGE